MNRMKAVKKGLHIEDYKRENHYYLGVAGSVYRGSIFLLICKVSVRSKQAHIGINEWEVSSPKEDFWVASDRAKRLEVWHASVRAHVNLNDMIALCEVYVEGQDENNKQNYEVAKVHDNLDEHHDQEAELLEKPDKISLMR